MNRPLNTQTIASLAYDEMRDVAGDVRAHYRPFADWLARTPPDRVAQKKDEAERAFHRVGITFAVYGEDAGTKWRFPFDIAGFRPIGCAGVPLK